MSIKRAVLILTLFVMGMIAALLLLGSKLMVDNALVSEQQQVSSEMMRAKTRLAQQLTDFGSFVSDWAAWDDPYEFITSLDEQFVTDNVTAESMKTANLSLIVFLDTTGKMIFSRAIDIDKGEDVPLSSEIADRITTHVQNYLFSGNDAYLSGSVIDDNQVIMLAAYPLIGSSRTRPIVGTLVMGRRFIPASFELGNNQYLTNTMSAVSKELQNISDLNKARVVQGEIVIVTDNAEQVTSYQAIADIDKELSILMKVVQPRTILIQAKKAQISFGMILGALGIGFVGLLIFISERIVANPLLKLRKSLGELVERHDFGGRVNVAGLSEYQEVSKSINQLMEMNQKLAESAWSSTKKMKEQLVEIELKNEDMEKTKIAIMNILDDERELEEQLRKEKVSIEETVAERTRELIEEQAKLEGSIDSLPVGYLMIDKLGNGVMVNKEARKVLGNVDLEKMVMIVKAWLKENKDLNMDEQSGLPNSSVLMGGIINNNNGYVDLSVVPIQVINNLNNREERIGWVALVSDVTEAKNLQRSRDEFFSIASHELRTPLTAIRGNTALIKDYYPEIMKDESVHQIIDDIHAASIRLISIVNDFLDASRLELKKIEFKIEQFDIAPLISKVTEAICPTAKEKQIGCDLKVGEIPSLTVTGDLARTEQILYNLMGNAIKFTKEGGVTIELKRANNTAEVWVTDSGMGIPTENQRLLFRKFQQAGESVFTREASQGSGMGLYISRLLAEGMGGTIRLEASALGKGSTFVLSLPIVG